MALRNPFKKEPSQAEQNRLDKKKTEQDRARMEDLKSRLVAASAFVSTANLTDEQKKEVRALCNEAAQKADSVVAVTFRVEGIDKCMSDTMGILERALEKGGSYNTIRRCLTGIAYGILTAHSPISAHSVETDIVMQRENTAARYFRIAQLSFEMDGIQKELDKERDQKRSLELQLEDAKSALQEMIDENPAAWYDLQEMAPSDIELLTGDVKIMSALEKKVTDTGKNIETVTMLIAQKEEDLETLEHSCETMILQVSGMESQIDDLSQAEILRLQDEFEKEMLKARERMNSLDESNKAFAVMIKNFLGGEDAIGTVIKNHHEYEEWVRRQEEISARIDAARQRRMQEELEEKQKQEQKQEETNTQSENDLYC